MLRPPPRGVVALEGLELAVSGSRCPAATVTGASARAKQFRKKRERERERERESTVQAQFKCGAPFGGRAACWEAF